MNGNTTIVHTLLLLLIEMQFLFPTITDIEQSFQSPPSNTYTLLGQNGIIDCTPPRSIPPPMITWFRDSTLVSGSQFSIAANGSLLISGAMFSNEGDYVCVANNELLGITRSSSSAHFSVYGESGKIFFLIRKFFYP